MFPLHDDNPTRIVPYVTYVLILACVAIFFWQLSLGEQGPRAIFSLGVIPSVIFNINKLAPELAAVPAWATLITSMFLHGGWMHLIGNMLYLWIFGNNVEDAMGHRRFIVFYLVCGIAAALAQAIPDPQSTTPMIGASGAISGVLGAYLLLYPHARVLVIIPLGFIFWTTRIKAGWVLSFWFIIQTINSLLMSEQQGGGVAWGAHIGGFIAGMMLVYFFKQKHVPLFAPAQKY